MKRQHVGPEHLHELFDKFTGAVMVTDPARCISFANEAALQLFGYSSAELVGSDASTLYASVATSEEIGELRDRPRGYVADPGLVTTMKRADGTVFKASAQGGPICGPDGTLQGYVGFVRDATAAERAVEVLLRIHEITADTGNPLGQRIGQLLDLCAAHFGLPLAIVSEIEGDDYTVIHCVDPSNTLAPGQILELGRTYCSLTLKARGPVGFHHAGAGELRDHPCYVDTSLEAYLGCPIYVEGKPYGTLSFSRSSPSQPYTGADHALIRLIASWLGSALTEERYRDNLVHLANHDSLTGLLNRRVAMERLGWLRAQARRSCLPLTILVFDLDHFKRINDSHGHAAGDRALVGVAAAAMEAVRMVDQVARLGGEEFLVLLPDTPLEGASVVYRRIRDGLAKVGLPPSHKSDTLTASFGAAQLQEDESVDELLRRADTAAYQAKANGRDSICLAR